MIETKTAEPAIGSRKKFTTYDIVLMAMFTAILCVSAYISFALPNGSHITFLNFVSTIIALVFAPVEGVMIIAVWMILGCIGIPVFIAGNAGPVYLFGPYGGYYLAFLLTAIFCPIMLKLAGGVLKLFSKSGSPGGLASRISYTFVAVLSVILVDLVGMIWWMISADLSLKVAFVSGFLSFIVLDIVKAVVAAQLAPFIAALRRVYKK